MSDAIIELRWKAVLERRRPRDVFCLGSQYMIRRGGRDAYLDDPERNHESFWAFPDGLCGLCLVVVW